MPARSSAARPLGGRFFDGDAHFDAHRGGVRGIDAEAETRAVRDARRYRQLQRDGAPDDGPCRSRRRHGSVHVSPRPPHTWHVPRSGTSSGSTTPRVASRVDTETSVVSVSASAGSPRNESRTRATTCRPTENQSRFRRRSTRRPRRRDESCPTASARALDPSYRGSQQNQANDRSGSHACQGTAPMLSSSLTTTNKKHARRARMPALRLRRCGSSESQQVVRVPGNPSDTTRSTAEWVCPDCDYFEEAEGD